MPDMEAVDQAWFDHSEKPCVERSLVAGDVSQGRSWMQTGVLSMVKPCQVNISISDSPVMQL